MSAKAAEETTNSSNVSIVAVAVDDGGANDDGSYEAK